MTLPLCNLPIQLDRSGRVGHVGVLNDLDRVLQFVPHGGNQPIMRGVRVHVDSEVTLTVRPAYRYQTGSYPAACAGWTNTITFDR